MFVRNLKEFLNDNNNNNKQGNINQNNIFIGFSNFIQHVTRYIIINNFYFNIFFFHKWNY